MMEFRDRVRLFSGGAMRYAALFAIAAIVVAGIMYVTAYGDDERIKTAKTTVKFALLGLVLALLSFSLVNAVMYFIYGLGA